MSRPERTPRQIRTAAKRRGNVPGFLGVEEMAMLMPKPVAKCDGCGRSVTAPELIGRWCGQRFHLMKKGSFNCQGTFRALAGETR